MNLLGGVIRLGSDNLISDIKSLLLSALGVFLLSEYGSFNTF